MAGNIKKANLPNESALKKRVKSLIKNLDEFYPVFKPKKRYDPLDELVLTILSQNTNDNNSFEGYKRLKSRFPTWDKVARANPKTIEKTISIAGLAPTKTKYIKGVLDGIGAENRAKNRLKKGSPYHLNHLKKMTLEEALDYLTSFKGVGQKTAACVLAFSLDMPSFPIDTHVRRILVRQGIIPANMTAENAHHVMYRLTIPDERYRFHMSLIRYGRDICHARNPECDKCVIKRNCGYNE
jgi:endonuclease-3